MRRILFFCVLFLFSCSTTKKVEDDKVRSNIEKANYCIENNQPEEALKYLKKAIKDEPNNAVFYQAQGSLLDQIGKYDEAKASYKKAIKINPDYFDPYFCLGAMIYNRASVMISAAGDIPVNKQKKYDASIDAAHKQMNKAIPYFEKCHSINPNDIYTMEMLKVCYYKLRSKYPEYDKKYTAISKELKAAKQK